MEEGQEWKKRAVCRGLDPAIFYPVRPRGPKARSDDGYGRAKLICQQCPVREECYRYAVRNGERYGIWGGEVFDRDVRRQERRMEKGRGVA